LRRDKRPWRRPPLKRAKTVAGATEIAARDAAQTAAHDKKTLEAKVSELEHDLGTTTMDLVTASRQFSQVTTQLQVATEEATQLHDNNAKLSQDLEGQSRGPFLSFFGSLLAPHSILICWLWSQGHA
jgi:hypothetical protein